MFWERARQWMRGLRHRWVPVAILGVYLGLYARYDPPNAHAPQGDGVYRPMLARGDGYYIYLEMLSLGLDLDVEIENQLRFGDPFAARQAKTPTGKMWPWYAVGTALCQLPTFYLAEGSAWVLNLFGADLPLDGYSLWHQRVTYLGTVLAGFFALFFGYRIACRYVSRTAATWALVAVALGTGVCFYSVYWVSYPHAFSAFAVALLLDYWDRTRGRFDLRRMATLGVLCGFAALTRMQEITFVILPAAEIVAELASRVRRRDARGSGTLALGSLLAAIGGLVVLFPQLWMNKVYFGGWLVVAQGPHYMRWDSPFFWEVLYSSHQGLFVWTPLAYVGILGLFAARPGARRLAAGLLLAFLLQGWVNGSIWDWHGNFGFGARRLVDMTPLFIVGIAFVVSRLQALHARVPRLAPRLALGIVLLPFVAMNLEMSDGMTVGRVKGGAAVDSAKFYVGSLGRIMGGAQKWIGNPFSWPANWIWAAKHRVLPGRYDELVGDERLVMPFVKYQEKGTREQASLPLHAAGRARYGTGPWKATADGKAASASSGARLLIPLFVADDVRLSLMARRGTATSPPRLLVNGQRALPVTLAETTTEVPLVIPQGALHTGTNELEIQCEEPGGEDCVTVESVTLVYEVPK
jgi:hypothetical protein